MDQIKLKVLIIDDEVDFTEELHEFLSFRGFSTNAANTAEEGLDFLKKNEHENVLWLKKEKAQDLKLAPADIPIFQKLLITNWP